MSTITAAIRLALIPKSLFAVLLSITIALWTGTDAKAQSFLEKLEQAVREQIDQQPTETATGELPVPKAAPPASQNNLPVPPPVSEENRSSASRPPAGRIYLGLEAEDVVGGGIGVRVASVAEQSPAWKSGFEVGDRILAVNGFAVANLKSMAEQMGKTAPGQSVKFLVTRAGQNKQLTAVLMAADLAGQMELEPGGPEMTGQAWLGLRVNDVTDSFRQQFGITVFRGAAVASVAPNSPAHKAGIRPGEAVVEADGTPIDSANDLTAWMAGTTPGQKVELVVYRGGFPRAAEIVLEVNPEDARAARRPTPSVANFDPQLDMQADAPNTATPAPPIPSNPADDIAGQSRLQLLEEENRRLSAELEQTRQRLMETQAKLDQILKLLNDR